MITLAEIDVSRITFRTPGGNLYVVGADEMDFVEFLKRYPGAARATGLGFDDGAARFYAVAVADCFDPPVAIIRAENESDALEIFLDELDWAHVSDPDLADYREDELDYNSDGVPCDTGNISLFAVKPETIEV